MNKMMTCAMLVALSVTLAVGQDQSTTEYKKFEVFAGYSAYNMPGGNPEELADADSNSTPTYRGWNASAVFNFNRFLGVKADASGHYKKFTLAGTDTLRVRADASVYNFVGGVQLKDNKKSKRFAPFLHAMGGAAVSRVELKLPDFSGLPALGETRTRATLVVGGGLDLKLNKRLSVRLIQADYNPTFGAGGTRHNVRLGFGIVFN